MALFRRNKQQQTQIPELQDYYATQKKEGSGKAWLLAVGSLLITIAIFIGLFMGGRWLYRAVTNNDEPVQTAQTETEKTDSSTSSNTATAPNPDPSTSTPGTTTIPGGAQGVSPSQSAQSNQSASAATTSIPNTGPSSVAVIFAITTIAGAVLHRRITLSKN